MNRRMRNGILGVDDAALVALILGVLSFFGGAISEAESNGQITDSISYSVDENKSTICKEFYPKIILTDK